MLAIPAVAGVIPQASDQTAGTGAIAALHPGFIPVFEEKSATRTNLRRVVQGNQRETEGQRLYRRAWTMGRRSGTQLSNLLIQVCTVRIYAACDSTVQLLFPAPPASLRQEATVLITTSRSSR